MVLLRALGYTHNIVYSSGEVWRTRILAHGNGGKVWQARRLRSSLKHLQNLAAFFVVVWLSALGCRGAVHGLTQFESKVVVPFLFV